LSIGLIPHLERIRRKMCTAVGPGCRAVASSDPLLTQSYLLPWTVILLGQSITHLQHVLRLACTRFGRPSTIRQI